MNNIRHRCFSNTRTLICSLSAVLFLISLISCTTFDADTSYSPAENKSTGLVALSLTATYSNLVALPFRSGYSDVKGEVALCTNKNPCDWPSPVAGRVATVELPAGKYEFYNWQAPTTMEYMSIPFEVKPGRVTYIGNIHLAVYSDRIYFHINDKSSRDLPILFRRYKNVGPTDIDIAITGIRSHPVFE